MDEFWSSAGLWILLVLALVVAVGTAALLGWLVGRTRTGDHEPLFEDADEVANPALARAPKAAAKAPSKAAAKASKAVAKARSKASKGVSAGDQAQTTSEASDLDQLGDGEAAFTPVTTPTATVKTEDVEVWTPPALPEEYASTIINVAPLNASADLVQEPSLGQPAAQVDGPRTASAVPQSPPVTASPEWDLGWSAASAPVPAPAPSVGQRLPASPVPEPPRVSAPSPAPAAAVPAPAAAVPPAAMAAVAVPPATEAAPVPPAASAAPVQPAASAAPVRPAAAPAARVPTQSAAGTARPDFARETTKRQRPSQAVGRQPSGEPARPSAAAKSGAGGLTAEHRNMEQLVEQLRRSEIEMGHLEALAVSAWDRTVPNLEGQIAQLQQQNAQLVAQVNDLRQVLGIAGEASEPARQPAGKQRRVSTRGERPRTDPTGADRRS